MPVIFTGRGNKTVINEETNEDVKSSTSEEVDLNTYREKIKSLLIMSFLKEVTNNAYNSGRSDSQSESYSDAYNDVRNKYLKDPDKFISKDLKFSLFECHKKNAVNFMNLLFPGMDKDSTELRVMMTNYYLDLLDESRFYKIDDEFEKHFYDTKQDKLQTYVYKLYKPSKRGTSIIYDSNNESDVVEIVVGRITDKLIMEIAVFDTIIRSLLEEMKLDHNLVGTNSDEWKIKIENYLRENFPKEYLVNSSIEDSLFVNVAVFDYYDYYTVCGQPIYSFKKKIEGE